MSSLFDSASWACSAEKVFRRLAEEWRSLVSQTERGRNLPKRADTLALSCLLLASEWGNRFTDAAIPVAEACSEAAFAYWEIPSYASSEALAWRLCKCALPGSESRESTLEDLIDAFNHPTSGVRIWAMRLGWVVRSWLSPEEAVPPLLKNVADTIGGVEMAMGLAWAVCGGDEGLEKLLAEYQPPARFAEQFSDRINVFRDYGFAALGLRGWMQECDCRSVIERVALA